MKSSRIPAIEGFIKGSTRRTTHVKQEGGFTLFETLAATMILAIAFVSVLQLFSGGLRADTLSEQYTRAIYHAREKMDELLLADELVEGQADGDWEDGYSWHINILRYVEEGKENAVLSSAKKKWLFSVELTVGWQDGARVRQTQFSTFAFARDENDNQR